MKPFKFLHMADLHIDTPFTALVSFGEAAADRRLEQKLLFKKAIGLAAERNVDVVLISGDLFEHEYVSRGTIAFINECFNSISHIKIFISPGNHDPYVKNSYYSTYEWASNVHIFKGEIESVYLDDLNACIYGVGFNDFFLYESKLKDFNVEDTSRINIMVTHATIDSFSGSPGYHMVSSAELEKSGLDYIALGHIHKYSPQLVKGKACYPGSMLALGFDEPGVHGVVVGQINRGQVNFEPVPIDAREYITMEIDVTGCAAPQALAAKVTEKIKIDCNFDKKNYYRAIITGTVKAEIIDDLDLINKILEVDMGNSQINIKFELLPEYELREIMLGNDLKALFVKRLVSEIEEELDEKEKRRLEKILHLGLCALEGRKVKSI